MFQTLLLSQLFKAENPHCLKQGALNDMQDEDEGGLVHADRLPLRYNALDFRCPDVAPNNLLQENLHDPRGVLLSS